MSGLKKSVVVPPENAPPSPKHGTISLVLQILYSAVILWLFYAVLVWNIGSEVARKCKESMRCSWKIKKGWFGSYDVDLADGQWKDFRSTLWLMCIAAVAFSFIQFLIRRFCTYLQCNYSTVTHSIVYFRIVAGAVLLVVQHGYHAMIVIGLSMLGFFLTKAVRQTKHGVIVMWIYGILILLFKESYRLKKMSSTFEFLGIFFDSRYGGMYGWQLPANFLFLRVISFSMDMIQAQKQHDGKADEKKKKELKEERVAASSETDSPVYFTRAATRRRKKDIKTSNDVLGSTAASISPLAPSLISCSSTAAVRRYEECETRDLSEYSFSNCMSYMLYGPLYIGGPIITYNAYMRYTTRPQEKENVFIYGIRFILCFALMEFLLSKFPVFSILNSGFIAKLSIHELCVVCYIVLKLMWLKFLLIWRFMRLWAMMEGVLPPENMLRCMSNNFSIQQFWRGWHSSFNLWIVRYMYKPMGGSKSRMWSMFIIFTFVAIWHDIELKLLAWGFLNSGFMVVEMIAGKVTDSAAYNSLSFPVRRLLADMSGGIYIMILIGVNLVGYSIGVGGAGSVFEKLLSWDGLQATLVGYVLFSSGVNIMMLLRDYGYTSNL